MNTFNLILSTILHLLLLTHTAECTFCTLRDQCLLQALRANRLEAYADFLEQYPTPEMNDSDIIVFAPSNKAVKAYLAANPDTEQDTIHRRDAAKNVKANKNNFAKGANSIAKLPAKGKVFGTGGSGSSGKKVAKAAGAGGGGGGSGGSGGKNGRKARNIVQDRPQSYVATITAGGGIRTKVLQEGISFQSGLIYAVDTFFNPTVDFGTTITAPSGFDLTYLGQIFDRIPHARDKLFGAEQITFLAPTQEAFNKTGLNASTSKSRLLQKFLDNHTFTNGFLGYTPSFEDGKCYTTDGGSQFVPKFNGTHTLLNDAVIIGEDYIVETGVIQIIDKVLYCPTKKPHSLGLNLDVKV
ncbi:hypothetical protein EV426DRAFT_721572 [Tirmania nivea]|nr:hypothetical protein EV426DRAFT_721572 [Tirmania nivea]